MTETISTVRGTDVGCVNSRNRIWTGPNVAGCAMSRRSTELVGGRGSVMGGITGHHSTRLRGEQGCVVASATSHNSTMLMGGRGSVMGGVTGHHSTRERGEQGCVVSRMRD